MTFHVKALLFFLWAAGSLGVVDASTRKTSVVSNTTISRRLTRVNAHTVQPLARDQVHTVWVNGPSHHSQLGVPWPGLGNTTKPFPKGHACDPNHDAYTGYNDRGAYCQLMDDYFDKHPHLVVHSGNVGMVLDATAAEGGSLVRQLGSIAAGQSTSDIYKTLPHSNLCATVTLNCTNLPGYDFPLELIAGLEPTTKAEFGLIRHGHTVTHMDVRNLHWLLKGRGTHLRKPECAGIPDPEPVRDPTNPSCNISYSLSGGEMACSDPNYPICVGYVQEEGGDDKEPQWGSCYSDPDVCNVPFAAPWLETTVWPDLVSLHLHWNGTEGIEKYGCTGLVKFSVAQGDKVITKTDKFETGSNLGVLLTNKEGSTSLQQSTMAPHELDVVSTNALVLARDPYQDILLDVPKNTPKCSDHPCDKEHLIHVSVGNPKATAQTLRMSLTRNFPTFMDDIAPKNRDQPGSEITGMNIIVMDASGTVPLGIPTHISKDWHDYEGHRTYYAGMWWTCNIFLHLPPKAKLDFSFKIIYEKYGGVSAFSQAQLSIVGYSNKWLWEQAALGTGGENFCMDPLGSHTRATITDVRPKLFDGKWKDNIGGGDFLLYFDNKGVMQSSKTALDSQLHVNGPCLSNVTHTSTTMDGAIHSTVQVSGGRTDDLVRVFIHLRYTATRDAKFSRLTFFQMGSETYNYHSNFHRFVFGSGDKVSHNFPRACTGRTSLARAKLYDWERGVYRETLPGHGPWWFSMAATEGDPYNEDSSTKVVGDRSFVIREYGAHLGGQSYLNPSVSVLCDKLEVGTPKGVSELKTGDFVDFKLEMVIYPRIGTDFDAALANSGGSRSLRLLYSLPTPWERVKAQATYHIQVRDAVPQGARIESHYPIRVCVPDYTDTVEFKVYGKALGFVPIVICGLSSVTVEEGQGLWFKVKGGGEEDEDYTLLQQATYYRQANFDRQTGRYELVFNVELLRDDECVIFAFIPTNDPTYVPTGLPTASPTVQPKPTTPARTAAMFGDPHIMTWNGETFDFHGGCDLVLATVPRLDMDLHVRTRIRTWWSFIYQAAVRIGADTLEVQGSKDSKKILYWINGKPGSDDIEHGAILNETIAGHPIHFRWTSGGQRQFRLDLDDGDAIFFKTYGEFVRVNVHVESSKANANHNNKFAGSLGLMGSYPDGLKVARDNRTIVQDVNQFGQEWQTQVHEPQLFHEPEPRRRLGSSVSRKCQMPRRSNNAGFYHVTKKRRLLEGGELSQDEAAVACAHVEAPYKDSCIYDVLVTGQLGLAGSY